MAYFVGIAIGVIIIVAILSSYLLKKNPSKNYYIFPGSISTIITLVVAIISYFIMDGWSTMGYLILFVFVGIASFIGTILGKSFTKHKI
ncbi:YesK family protein [Bacillus norwichensis]|uniref:Uncharacterized protein n=1 Tax=Bacillus norwichensis TaxID=2762217 RepID=A0ABR8VS92_9BACI|nr:YesK family protein [Bacillus norwichensis]MBD8007582.1 hypothetical protein [Bacillus norwichensis]